MRISDWSSDVCSSDLDAGVIEGGDELKVFDLKGVRAGIAVCYDSEFPLPVRAQREAGVRLLLVPSCTDTQAGATRVRVGCMARALENRMFIAQAVTTRSEERRVGKSVSVRVDLGGRRIIKKKKQKEQQIT